MKISLHQSYHDPLFFKYQSKIRLKSEHMWSQIILTLLTFLALAKNEHVKTKKKASRSTNPNSDEINELALDLDTGT